MNTIKNFQWLVLAVCLFVLGTIRVMADNKDDDAPSVPIPLTTGDVINGGEARNGVIPFTAYYQDSTIYISSSAEFLSITINVVNKTTNQVWNYTTDISDGMGEICIPNGSTSSYTVEIVTEYGKCFTGSFIL